MSDVGKAVWAKHGSKAQRGRQPMVAMAVIPQPGTNYVDIADASLEFEKLKRLANGL